MRLTLEEKMKKIILLVFILIGFLSGCHDNKNDEVVENQEKIYEISLGEFDEFTQTIDTSNLEVEVIIIGSLISVDDDLYFLVINVGEQNNIEVFLTDEYSLSSAAYILEIHGMMTYEDNKYIIKDATIIGEIQIGGVMPSK